MGRGSGVAYRYGTMRDADLEDDDERFLRQYALPEEDLRHIRYWRPWRGEYRWFRAPNVVCIEKARRARESRPRDLAGPKPAA
jgi:hypothetical protein